MRFVGLIQCVIYYKTNIANLAFHLAIFLHRFRRALHIAGIVQEISAVFGRHDILTQSVIPLSTGIHLFFCKLFVPTPNVKQHTTNQVFIITHERFANGGTCFICQTMLIIISRGISPRGEVVHSIPDETARTFAAQLYSSIGFGHSLKKAFDQAKAELILEGIPGEDIPQLYCRPDVDPDNMVLVQPNT